MSTDIRMAIGASIISVIATFPEIGTTLGAISGAYLVLLGAAVAGCVPSLANSLFAHVRPSLRGCIPLAQRYGPHAIHGAASGTLSAPARDSMTTPGVRI